MVRLRAPITCIGGKGNLIPKLLPLIPPHRLYVEVFGGAATMLCAKEPSLSEVYNDLDGEVVNLFRVLRDPLKCAELHGMLSLTPYSRKEFELALELSKQDLSCEVTKAWSLYVRSRQSFSARREDWGYTRLDSHRGMAGASCRWLSSIDLLIPLCQRLSRVQIECADWRKILSRFDSPETFFYLDPPYVLSACTGVDYAHTLSDADHGDLIQAIQRLQGKVLLSGYPSEIYQALPKKKWRQLRWDVAAHSVVASRTSGISENGGVERLRLQEKKSSG